MIFPPCCTNRVAVARPSASDSSDGRARSAQPGDDDLGARVRPKRPVLVERGNPPFAYRAVAPRDHLEHPLGPAIAPT